MRLSVQQVWTSALASGAWVGLLLAEGIAGAAPIATHPAAAIAGVCAAALVTAGLGLLLRREDRRAVVVGVTALGSLGMVLHGAFRLQAQLALGLIHRPVSGLEGEARTAALASLADGPQLQGARNFMAAPIWWPPTRHRACVELATLELDIGQAALMIGTRPPDTAVLDACGARTCAPEVARTCQLAAEAALR